LQGQARVVRRGRDESEFRPGLPLDQFVTVFVTPGAADAPSGQIAERVFRYTLRSDDSFLGWLSSYFNVPYLFGSAGKGARSQAERYIGADCADVLVAALRRAGRHDLEYSSVAGLADSFERVAGPAVVGAHDAPISSLRVGADVRPGDLLALDYVGAAELPRALDHIVAFVEDRGPDGTADGRLGPKISSRIPATRLASSSTRSSTRARCA